MSKFSPLLWLLLFLTPAAWAHTGEGQGPPTAALKRLFPTADNFVTRPLNLTPDLQKRLTSRLGQSLESHDLKSSAYVPTLNGQSLGVAWVTDAHLKEGPVDVIVGVDREGRIVGVALDHSPVALLAQSSYLNQFKGLTAGSGFGALRPLNRNPRGSKLVAAAVRKAAIAIDETFVGGSK